MKRKNTILIIVTGIIVVGAIFYFFKIENSSADAYVVKRGNLEAIINSRGEVQGEKSTRIELPKALCDFSLGVFGFKINNLIEEGKSVKKGDFIASLDPSEIFNSMRSKQDEKERTDADLKNAVIDSMVILTKKREEITNAILDMEYLKVDLEMSKYESAAEQRKTKMKYQKAEIALDKKRRDYKLEQNKLKVRIIRQEERVKRLDEYLHKYRQAISSNSIFAPEDGIVSFARTYDGKKLTKDSHVNIFNPLVATLPDMSKAIAETYIKEIDIAKINKGDSVRIVVDALPDKTLPGKIINIANMGEDKDGFDMKVFKVIVRIDYSDPGIKAGMACNVDVILNKYENQLLVPLEAVFIADNKSFVYKKEGHKIFKQLVTIGGEDELNAIVLKGLNEGDKVLTIQPDSMNILATEN